MTHRLFMHQAGRGDFLSLRSPTAKILVDTGPAECAGMLSEQLCREPADLLVIAHLDEAALSGV